MPAAGAMLRILALAVFALGACAPRADLPPLSVSAPSAQPAQSGPRKMFTFDVFKDPDVPSTIAQRALVQSAAAPDAMTFVVRWSATYANADQAEGMEPLPRHLVQELYRADKEAFVNSPVFGTEFVGLGP